MAAIVEWIGGNCPVQAEGTIGGRPFYFRARGPTWFLVIEMPANQSWERQREWSDGPLDAGWMPLEVARQFIEECAADYLAGRPA